MDKICSKLVWYTLNYTSGFINGILYCYCFILIFITQPENEQQFSLKGYFWFIFAMLIGVRIACLFLFNAGPFDGLVLIEIVVTILGITIVNSFAQ